MRVEEGKQKKKFIPDSNRLFQTQTLNSLRRYESYLDPTPVNDHLDFSLRQISDTSRDWNKSTQEVVTQPETSCEHHGRILKNNIEKKILNINQMPPDILRVWDAPQKEDFDKANNAISGPHTQMSNSGYSRKADGGVFYN